MSDFSDIHDELSWRGALFEATPDAERVLKTEKISCYNGFDPTSDSLHIGNLLPIMCLARMQRYGHTPIAILGAGTGLIGDPSGRSHERPLLSIQEINSNAEAIREQLANFLDFDSDSNPAKLINNADWLLNINLIEFLRDTGKRFTVNTMLKREAVQGRMERTEGISYAEFSYQMLQAYDFLMLYQREGCTFQSGGSDQLGNILSGIDLIRRIHGSCPDGASIAHGIVFPLITDSKGDKLGKSIGGAPALSAVQFSPYRLYQFFYNTDDEDVIRYLKLFTWLGPKDITPLILAVQNAPGKRQAQTTLAQEVTRIVHGESGLQQAQRVTSAFFKGAFDTLSGEELADVFAGTEAIEIPKSTLENSRISYEELAIKASLASSLSEIRRIVKQRGMYLNSQRIEAPDRAVTTEDLLHGGLIVLRRGKREHRLVRVN